MHHILSVLVEDRSGVLSRVAGLFSRRGYSIDSIAVGPTEDDAVSRMVIVVRADEEGNLIAQPLLLQKTLPRHDRT